MAKYCTKCGARLDETTGLCPNCDAEQIRMEQPEQTEPAAQMEQPEQTEPATQMEQPKQTESAAQTEQPEPAVESSRVSQEEADPKAVGNPNGGGKRHHVLRTILLILLVLILLGAGALAVVVYSGVLRLPDTSATAVDSYAPAEERVSAYDDGDTVYTPAADHIQYDAEAHARYYDNMLIVYTFDDLSKQEAEALAALVDGTIVGDVSGGVNILQIQVEPTTLDELKEFANRLMESDQVMYADYDYPTEISLQDAGTDPWSDGEAIEDRGNEDNPAGNDWWAEAIGAYTAWEYSDRCEGITAGIVDNGFDMDHEDLEGSIQLQTQHTVNSIELGKGRSHGTHVAGLVGAHNNTVGIRGVADMADLMVVDFKPDEQLSSIEMIAANKQLIQSGARVVNNSWGITFHSPSGYAESKRASKLPDGLNDIEYWVRGKLAEHSGDYDEYVSMIETEAEKNAVRGIYAIISLIRNGEDFLIVQAAGNGYDNGGNGGKGVDAHYSGAFCAIDEDVYNRRISDVEKEFNKQIGVDYASIKNHVIIVGAVRNERPQDDEDGYLMTTFSDYGPNVDICAPGQDVYSTIPDDQYKNDSGTSMAAPIVSGAAAYLWSLDPSLSAAEVKTYLTDSTTRTAYGVGGGAGTTYPMLNLGESVEALIETLPEDEEEPVKHIGERDIVMALDISGSMNGTPIEETRKAAIQFVDAALEEDAGLGIVKYSDSAEVVSEISTDSDALQELIGNLDSYGNTDIEAGLGAAYGMLENSGSDKRIIVLMSDGEPNRGLEGNALVDYADWIKDQGVLIYTLGFFQEADNKASAQALLNEIASEGCHYEVASAEDLVYFFGDIVDQINGQRYVYVRIACPVDVTVAYNGEILCSSDDRLNTRTAFGTLSFEENQERSYGNNDRTKVLRLKEGADYDVHITGTGRGLMDYTIGLMDENHNYTDQRTFKNIRVTKDTVVDTTATASDETVLHIDNDGDGKYDQQLKAGANEQGKTVRTNYLLYGGIAAAVLVLLLVLILVFRIRRKRAQAAPVSRFRKAVAIVKCVLILAVLAAIAVVVIRIVSARTGSNALLRTVMKAYKDYDIDALIEASSDVYYYGSGEDAEDYYIDTIRRDMRHYEDTLEGSYKLGYKVHDKQTLSRRRLEDVRDRLADQYAGYDADAIDKAVVSEVTVTATRKGESCDNELTVMMIRENGTWRLLYLESAY